MAYVDSSYYSDSPVGTVATGASPTGGMNASASVGVAGPSGSGGAGASFGVHTWVLIFYFLIFLILISTGLIFNKKG